MLSSVPSISDVKSLAAGVWSDGFNSHARYIRLLLQRVQPWSTHVFTVYWELGNGKPISPLILFFKAVYAEELLNLLVNNFCLTICYGPTHWDYIDLVNFSLFLILSDWFRLQSVWRFPMETHFSHDLHHFTNTCLPHGKPCFIKLNFILDSSFPCPAWLCCHTHAYSSCYASSFILPPL